MFKIKTTEKIYDIEGNVHIDGKGTDKEVELTIGILLSRMLASADSQKNDAILCMDLAKQARDNKEIEINSVEDALIRSILKESRLAAFIVGPILKHMDTQKLKAAEKEEKETKKKD